MNSTEWNCSGQSPGTGTESSAINEDFWRKKRNKKNKLMASVAEEAIGSKEMKIRNCDYEVQFIYVSFVNHLPFHTQQ